LGDGGSALPSFYSADMDFDSDAEVRFTSLDALLPEVLEDIPDPAEDAGESRPRVTVKIDVEGGESDVFAHGREFLDTLRPDILCEVLADRAKPPELMGHLGRAVEHTSELQSRFDLGCRLLREKKKG